jgi:hypothetical protein
MREPQRVGPYLDIVDARDPENSLLAVKVGILDTSFQQVLHHHRATLVAQYYGIIQSGLMDAVHVFRGLNRPLLHDGNKAADDSVLAYCWRPKEDFIWVHAQFSGHPISKQPPPNRVFVVLVREESQPNDYGVFGSIEHWSWLAEDPNLPLAPSEHLDRYKTRLWSRPL